ncbi:GntR family transcriptional regulator [Propionicicella superfundia]|uniref:GntR family transcriptional regulator n=1 Tax=Propionicicella superfundia TaxID=348582 RepID=UPI000416D409|nr:GntR family transcriptional regulator [Propionicicella superfundia]
MDEILDISQVEGPNLTTRLETLLRAHIRNGVWKENEFIPNELDIADQAQVSRNTVRVAIQRLVSDDLLARVRGKGTYVTAPSPSVSLGIARIRETIHHDQQAPIARVVREEYGVPPSSVAEAFGLEAGETLYYVERARYRLVEDSTPVMYQYTWVLPELGAHISSRELVFGRIANQLRDKCGVETIHVRESIAAVGASKIEARELGVPLGAPLVWIEEQRYDENERLHTLGRFTFPPAIMQLRFEHYNAPTVHTSQPSRTAPDDASDADA